MTEKTAPRAPFEEALIKALCAIDNQVAREMQRSPAELDKHGVQKWPAYQKRIEQIVSTVLNALGDGEVNLDGVLVLAQALTKTLLLAAEDLGRPGLGKVRSQYCETAFKAIGDDVARGADIFKPEQNLN